MIDLDMLAFIADRQPQWSIVLVGPVAESGAEFYSKIQQLKQRPNIHFLGPKRPEDLPAYINTFDVCLLPYVQGEISRYYAAPLKFYEYLAAGRPVVSTVGPRIEDREVVINCASREDVLSAIHEALAQNPAAAAKRKAIAARNSWTQRVRQIDDILSRLPKRK
jgi:glycosyltransferase involved in cell wall biosynthesis